MIIFIADGRLGNQIFQYAFLKKIAGENEKIITYGFDELFNVFDNIENVHNIISIKNKILKKLINKLMVKIFVPFLNLFLNLRIFSHFSVVYEYLGNYRMESDTFKYTPGLIKKIRFVKTGYFQSEKFINKFLKEKMKIKDEFLNEAERFLSPFKNKYKVFVHIRRGDYKNFKVLGKETLLPINYFHNQIRWFLENRGNCFFVFLSDEPDFIEKEFDYLENKIISRNSYEVDFAIMTLCNSAILSPSSFSWWGSYFMKEKDVVFAPKYWLGWKSNIEFPKGAFPSWAIAVEIYHE